MVGLGGGFILVPVLRLFMGFSPAYAAGTSLVLIVANSASGALTYILQRRVHLRIELDERGHVHAIKVTKGVGHGPDLSRPSALETSGRSYEEAAGPDYDPSNQDSRP